MPEEPTNGNRTKERDPPRKKSTSATLDWRSWLRSCKQSARDVFPCCYKRQTQSPDPTKPKNLELRASSELINIPEITMTKPNLPEADPDKPTQLLVSSSTNNLSPQISSTSSVGKSALLLPSKSLRSSTEAVGVNDRGNLLALKNLAISHTSNGSGSHQVFSESLRYGHSELSLPGLCSAHSQSSLASGKPQIVGSQRAKYHWALIRQFIRCTYAICGDRRMPWVQLAGHEGNFVTGDNGIVRKKFTPEEHNCLQLLMDDVLKPFAPLLIGKTIVNEEEFIEMRDLLSGFDPSVSVMDCKVGVRTYLEEELTKAKKNPKMRPDMYQKMIEVDPNEPTPEEHEQAAVTKPRYMQWRETVSSTATLGFRVEGIKKADGYCSKNFKFTKRKSEVMQVLRQFTDCNLEVIQMYIQRLKTLRKALFSSKFFAAHEVIGSSLLLIHDIKGLAGVWMIDFAKTMPLPEGVHVDHLKPWKEGNHEDGYLLGLNNLIDCFQNILFDKLSAEKQTAL
ncbi:hypothetical protein RvY_11582-2 [Ramazzottius varieornatus]|uniref:Kinase n=1 Tax=Ramazzottius varieornatus TaxID=947166 RepID=A0A1D1VIN1_RAMVA|nr:hypothetical protein RvY_11582-2 [Ramazzottius varieornatus]